MKQCYKQLAGGSRWLNKFPTFATKISQWWCHTDLSLNLLLAVPFVLCIFGGFGAVFTGVMLPKSSFMLNHFVQYSIISDYMFPALHC